MLVFVEMHKKPVHGKPRSFQKTHDGYVCQNKINSRQWQVNLLLFSLYFCPAPRTANLPVWLPGPPLIESLNPEASLFDEGFYTTKPASFLFFVIGLPGRQSGREQLSSRKLFAVIMPGNPRVSEGRLV